MPIEMLGLLFALVGGGLWTKDASTPYYYTSDGRQYSQYDQTGRYSGASTPGTPNMRPASEPAPRGRLLPRHRVVGHSTSAPHTGGTPSQSSTQTPSLRSSAPSSTDPGSGAYHTSLRSRSLNQQASASNAQRGGWGSATPDTYDPRHSMQPPSAPVAYPGAPVMDSYQGAASSPSRSAGRSTRPLPTPPDASGSVRASNDSIGYGGVVAAPKYANGLGGLRNLGNTCYMNACLQCLMHTDPVVEYFMDGHYRQVLRATRRRAPLTEAFADLIVQQQEGSKRVYNPAAVKTAVATRLPTFAGCNQQDAQEFLRFTLDCLHEELNRIDRKVLYEELRDIKGETDRDGSARWWANHRCRNDSFLMDLFCGQLKSHVQCRRCGYLSKAFDPFMDLSLPLKGESVEDCLARFMEPERLQGSERFICPTCKTQVDSTRKLSVYRWPEILVLHLKRFSYIGYNSKKLNNDINFSRQLDLSDFADPDTRLDNLHYRLYGLVHHIGGASGGHYTAACAQQSSEAGARWFSFDDSAVHNIPTLPLHGSTPYILFYTRCSTPLTR